jgi:flagellar hook assembly protein FlgD
VTIYDAAGRRVMRLVQGEVMSCDDVEVRWDGMSESGRPLPSGVYFVRMEVEGTVKTRKVTLVR